MSKLLKMPPNLTFQMQFCVVKCVLSSSVRLWKHYYLVIHIMSVSNDWACYNPDIIFDNLTLGFQISLKTHTSVELWSWDSEW